MAEINLLCCIPKAKRNIEKRTMLSHYHKVQLISVTVSTWKAAASTFPAIQYKRPTVVAAIVVTRAKIFLAPAFMLGLIV